MEALALDLVPTTILIRRNYWILSGKAISVSTVLLPAYAVLKTKVPLYLPIISI
jgi:hypothetical protein